MEKFLKAERLKPELLPYLYENNSFLVLRHPLICCNVYDLERCAYINTLHDIKQAEISQYFACQDFIAYIWAHSKSFRINAFSKVLEISSVTNEDYWHILSRIWRDGIEPHENYSLWLYLLSKDIPARHRMMTEENYTTLLKMPEEFQVYRGGKLEVDLGLSWTRNPQVAKYFQYKAKKAGFESSLQVGTVKNSDVIAYFTEDGKEEIISTQVKVSEIVHN